MSTRICLALLSIFLSFGSLAQEPETEPLTKIIEMERLIVTWSPNEKSLGRVTAYICQDCQATSMTIDPDARLEINGQLRPISDLKLKIDWSGAITVTDQAPTHILKFSMY